ncbi:uncharacterized protein LOC115626047 [Scaptodrosophila lebanonensis]|uniref:Uncharacterized protein LOC115626047 n=1 Tax=Drosophila lebanonensis TaxID=7225 RepID=A0A6J2TM79_DROLE|nr:uncharacterized protein LOC115626047 [Scaptodrosophila lebanonensis]
MSSPNKLFSKSVHGWLAGMKDEVVFHINLFLITLAIMVVTLLEKVYNCFIYLSEPLRETDAFFITIMDFALQGVGFMCDCITKSLRRGYRSTRLRAQRRAQQGQARSLRRRTRSFGAPELSQSPQDTGTLLTRGI